MSDAHKRKKQPKEVRRKLIECAVHIISEQGPDAVTIQAVADAAGVTKGGLLHHFSEKSKLIEAVLKHLLDEMDAEINKLMEQDSVMYGRFTRAYIKSVLQDLMSVQNENWMALAIYAITNSESQSLWNEWMNEKQKQHCSTDSDQLLQILMYSADGIWSDVAMRTGKPKREHFALLSSIIKMTYPDYKSQLMQREWPMTE